MALSSLTWRLASPYDAYVSHVARLTGAIERIRYFSERALGFETGLHASMRLVPAAPDAEARGARFREQLGAAAASMSDEEFEAFIADLGGGRAANVETDRAAAVSRLSHATRGLEEYFAIAGHELAILEKRGYDPARRDVARQLKANNLPATNLAEFRALLHSLGLRVGVSAPAARPA